MAKMRYQGIDAFRAPLGKLANLYDSQIMEVVNAGARVVEEAQKRYLRQHHYRTGELAASIGVRELPRVKAVIVEPTATQSGKGKRKRNKIHSRSGASRRAKHRGAAGGSTMQDVAYYLAIGTRKQRATDWDLKANKEAEEEVGKAMEAAWDKVLSEAGL